MSKWKVLSRITLWRSSRLKYFLNKKSNISEIKIGRKCCFDVKTTCQPAPLRVAGKVPDVVLKMSSGMMEGG